MEIKINKEIRDYQESVILGLSLRQFLFSLLAVGSALAVYFGLKDSLGTGTVSWLCILTALPFALLAFFKYHGMHAEEFIRTLFFHYSLPETLPSRPENFNAKLLLSGKHESQRVD